MEKVWIKKSGAILDYGCGYGEDVEYLRAGGFKVTGYDPHADFGFPEKPTGKYPVVLLIYVINTIDSAERKRVIEKAWKLVKPRGFLFIAARSHKDVERSRKGKRWKRHKDGYLTSRHTFQKGIKLLELISLTRRLRGLRSMQRMPAPYTNMILWKM